MKKLKKKKILNIDRPWLKFYKENVPGNLEYGNYMLWELVEKTVEKYPNYFAYDYYGYQVTYSKLMKQIERAARGLKFQGIKENDVVTICAPNTPQAIIMFYAINMVGAIANMIHPLSGEAEIENYLKIANSTMILTIDIAVEKIMNIIKNTKINKMIVMSASDDMGFVKTFGYWLLQGRKTKVPYDNEMIIRWRDFIDYGFMYDGEYKCKRDTNEGAVILYSGGTTGKPKGILLSNLNFNAVAMQSHLMCDPSKAGDSVLSILPIFHSFGLAVCIHTPLHAGMKCILIPAFNYKSFGTLIKKNKPNFVAGVPTLFDYMMKSKDLKNKDLSFITCCVSGGDAMIPELKRELDNYLVEHGSSAVVRIGYGLTEACGATCLTPSHEYRDGSIGVPFPDTYYKIVKTDTHTTAEVNTDGEICISGPSVMMGYINDQLETMDTLREHDDGRLWLHTGDIASMDSDGFVYFKQRLKRIIISSGYNLYPTYIENVITHHPSVMACTVIGIDHPYKVQVAKAFVVLNEGVKETEDIKKSIKEHCKKHLARYSIPAEFEYRTTLPKTLVGKVAVNELMQEEKNKRK